MKFQAVHARRCGGASGMAALACVAMVGGASAQDAPAPPRSVVLTGTLDTSIVATEGGRAATATSGGPRHDTALQLRPGFQLTSRGGRVRGSMTYSLDAIHHSRNEDSSGVQNSLVADFTTEAIENALFVDTKANVSQRSLSAFGQQSAPGSLQVNENRVEIGTVSVSPYLRGRISDLAVAEARYTASATNGRHSISTDSTTTASSLDLRSANAGAILGWGLAVTGQRSSFRAGRTTETERVNASIVLRPDVDFKLTLRGGKERTDVNSFEKQGFRNWGGELLWTPSPITQASIGGDHRYFGNSRRIQLSHRLPQSTLNVSSIRDVSSSSDPNGVGAQVTLYQLYSALLSSREPDPALRDQLVRDLLFSQGRDPNTLVGGGFVTQSVTLQRRDDFSWAYTGRRLALTMQGFRSSSRGLDDPSGTAGLAPTSQTGYTGNATWRLTPLANVSLTGSRQMTHASGDQPGNDLKSLAAVWSLQTAPRTRASLGVRYSVFNSVADPYRETAVTGTLSLRF